MLKSEERSKILTILRTSFMNGSLSKHACSSCWFPGLMVISREVKEYQVEIVSFLCCFVQQKARCLGSEFGRRSHLSEGLSFFPSKRDPRESSGGGALVKSEVWTGATPNLRTFHLNLCVNQHAQLVSMVNTSKYIHDREKIILHD